jgi:hypothetical protein
MNPECGSRSVVSNGSSGISTIRWPISSIPPPGRTGLCCRIVVLHELETGLAEEPRRGPMYGPMNPSASSLLRVGIQLKASFSSPIWSR